MGKGQVKRGDGRGWRAGNPRGRRWRRAGASLAARGTGTFAHRDRRAGRECRRQNNTKGRLSHDWRVVKRRAARAEPDGGKGGVDPGEAFAAVRERGGHGWDGKPG